MNEIKVSIITPLYKGMDYVPGLMAMIRKNAELLPDAQKGAFAKEDGEKVVDETGKRLK